MRLSGGAARDAAWRLVPGTVREADAVTRTRDFLVDGALHPGGTSDRVQFDAGAAWASTEDRSQLRRLHGLLFVSDWRVAARLLTEAESALLTERAAEVVQEWRRRFADRDSAPEMAYHDETTAQRLLMLVALTEEVLAEGAARDGVKELARGTAELLAGDSFYAGENNHGMFQDVALLAYAVLSDASSERRREEMALLALSRIDRYAGVSFTAEGVHIEHSPMYHLMVARTISLVAQVARAIGEAGVEGRLYELIDRAGRYATHAVTPRGVFPPISDTAQQPLRGAANLEVFGSEAFTFAATGGHDGRMPGERAVAFPRSGYGIFRSAWGDPDAFYCFFAAAYNGGYHKHSDDLSLHVEVAGVEVLREAGPYGYNYSDPFTAYGFSSFAHNTLVVDDKGLPRHDGRMGETWIEDLGTTPERLDVAGTTTRLDGVRFTRRVQAHGESADTARAVIEDDVESSEEHKYTFLWHLGPDVEPVVHADHVELFVAGAKVLEMSFETEDVFDLEVSRGRTAPQLRGWTFPRMGQRTPTTTLALTVHARRTRIVTRLRAGDYRLVDRGVRPGTEWQAHHGVVPLNYLVEVPPGPVEGLVVVFSAINKPFDFTYNYRATLADLPFARLFVLDDFGDEGSYYYARRRDLSPFVGVQALIARTLRSLGLTVEQLHTAGSSKGGTAALLHGLAAGAASVVVGAPQTRIGTFTRAAHPQMLRYIAGGTEAGDVLWLDGALGRVLRDSRTSTRVSVLVGASDHHHDGHVRPFVQEARERGLAVEDLVVPGTPHAQIGASYRQFLRSTFEHRAGADMIPHCVSWEDGGRLHVSMVLDRDALVATKLFRGRDEVASTPYSREKRVSWDGLAPGRYRVRVYQRPGREGAQMAFTTAGVVLPG